MELQQGPDRPQRRACRDMGIDNPANLARDRLQDRALPELTPAAPVGPLLVGSEIYRRSSYGAWHPLRIPRVSTVMDLARALGWFGEGQFVQSPRAKVAALKAAEASGEVSEAVRERHGLGTVSNPVFGEMFRRPATSVGASILAGE